VWKYSVSQRWAGSWSWEPCVQNLCNEYRPLKHSREAEFHHNRICGACLGLSESTSEARIGLEDEGVSHLLYLTRYYCLVGTGIVALAAIFIFIFIFIFIDWRFTSTRNSYWAQLQVWSHWLWKHCLLLSYQRNYQTYIYAMKFPYHGPGGVAIWALFSTYCIAEAVRASAMRPYSQQQHRAKVQVCIFHQQPLLYPYQTLR